MQLVWINVKTLLKDLIPLSNSGDFHFHSQSAPDSNEHTKRDKPLTKITLCDSNEYAFASVAEYLFDLHNYCVNIFTCYNLMSMLFFVSLQINFTGYCGT